MIWNDVVAGSSPADPTLGIVLINGEVDRNE